MRTEGKKKEPLGAALLRVVVGLWFPMLTLGLLSDHGAWLLRHFAVLPGIMPATSLFGAKTSDTALALACTAVIVPILTFAARRHPNITLTVSLAAGAFMALWLHALSQM